VITVAAVAAMFAIAMPNLTPVERVQDARAVVAALEHVDAHAWTPPPELVVAIIWRESRGMTNVCGNDRFGGAARGLMGIRRPHSRCHLGSDTLFNPRVNVEAGVKILIDWHAFEARVHHGRHDILDHYAGARSPSRYAREVRAKASELSRSTTHRREP
jgi:soluble lytic murein transglycosylase-like protein